MNDLLSRIAIALNPLIGLLLTVSGAAIGSLYSESPIVIAIGAVSGLALSVPLCGGIGLLASIDRHTQRIADEVVAAAVVGQPRSSAIPAATQVVAHARGHAMPATVAASARPDVVNGNGAGSGHSAADAAMAATEIENDYLNNGQFGLYHLSKAKRLMTAGKRSEALYQVSACLSHEPRNAEARELRRQARSQS